MLIIRFENELGTLEMGGGRHSAMRIVSLDGLGMPKKEFNTVTYPHEAGCTVTSVRDTSRTITIGGDIIGGRREIQRFMNILHRPGYLSFHYGPSARRIWAICGEFDDPERYGAGYNRAAMQFTCESPYFRDLEDTVTELYSLKDTVLGNTFTLPCVFTGKTSAGTITLSGGVDVYPMVEIVVGTSDIPQSIILTNATLGSVIRLDKDFRAGERILLDFERRTVESSLDGNILSALSASSVMSSFYLTPGANNLSVNTDVDNAGLYVRVTYSPLYIEAVR